ncbi:hypothetical protein AAFF_G00255650 [Aldrovandia affinis]|uniref:Uncharacterized protein n=1 Tax=Aldrovandia affinis TaxID=143900 RepID=A0AAD7RCA0_9TELE|nr:hypothetical protein AAFF_G00255650 [Aldrovandia affinis]
MLRFLRLRCVSAWPRDAVTPFRARSSKVTPSLCSSASALEVARFWPSGGWVLARGVGPVPVLPLAQMASRTAGGQKCREASGRRAE